jgi:hypothetical protein
MPRVATGQTMGPCIIIGERAGEMLRNAYKITKYERNIYAVGPDRIAAPLIEELSVPEILTPFIPGNSGPPGSRQRSLQREAGLCIGDELGDWAAWSVQQIAFIYRLGTARHRDHLGLGINDGSSC